MKRKNKGITIISLIVTVVILLILAGITIGSISGDDSIIEQTGETAQDAQKESIIQKIEADLYTEKVKTGEIPSKAKLKEIISENYGIIDKDGENEINSFTSKDGGYQIEFLEIDGWKRPITDFVKVGDYVDYEPTKKDVNKKQDVESSKLTYTSPTGTIPTESTGIITHGNGYTSTEEGGGQTFTAKANDGTDAGIKWRVLSVTDDKIELISEKPVLKDNTDQNSGNFVLKGGIGYLYAEQELNEICKIYGYGYGTDRSIETQYTVGGPEDASIIDKIKGSGARSITIEDLNKIANIAEDYTTLNSSYGTTTNPTTEVYYPTLHSSNTAYPGQGTSIKKGFAFNYYTWNKNKITDINIQAMLFNGNYWISSRCFYAYATNARFAVRCVHMPYEQTDAVYLCRGYSTYLQQDTNSSYAVRPVVTIKSSVINIAKPIIDENNITTWKLK